MSVEDFLSTLDSKSINSTQSILSKYEDDISLLVAKKIKQTIIIEYIFSIDKEIKDKYNDEKNIKTLKVMLSNFIKKMKSNKKGLTNRRSKKNLEADSLSSSDNNNESFKNSDGIVSKKSFLPPSEEENLVEDKTSNKKEIAQDFFSNTKKIN